MPGLSWAPSRTPRAGVADAGCASMAAACRLAGRGPRSLWYHQHISATLRSVLSQVTVASLSPGDVACPARNPLTKQAALVTANTPFPNRCSGSSARRRPARRWDAGGRPWGH
jgi:hypothetical protein